MTALDGSIYFPITGRPNNIGPIVCIGSIFVCIFFYMCTCMRTFLSEYVSHDSLLTLSCAFKIFFFFFCHCCVSEMDLKSNEDSLLC